MITLYGFGRAFGLPDPSPFVTKAEVLLKMAGVAYEYKVGDLRYAPKGKIPFIVDEGVKIGDSTFIRWHLEEKYGADFNAGYGPAELAIAWAFEKTCEEHAYWTLVDARWMVDANFDKGPRNFFKRVPAPIRPFIVSMIRRNVRKNLHAQGMGRHSRAEIERLAVADITAFRNFLGDKPFLLGDRPCGADATMFAFVGGLLVKHFDTPIRDAAEAMPTLAAYVARMQKIYYPDGF